MSKFVIPEKAKKPKLSYFGLAMPEELIAEIRKQAKKLRVTQQYLVSSMIIHCLRDLKEPETEIPNDLLDNQETVRRD